jgi:biopolymer transport protein ExbD
MKQRRDNLVEEAAFDLTPMIDVVMLLIVFFMLTAQFAASMRTPLDLPRQSGENTAESDHALVIELTREGQYRIETRPVEIERIVQLVAADLRRSESLDVVIRADRQAKAIHLNRLARELTRAGVRTWSIATTGYAEAKR